MPSGSKPGERRGGRQKGTPNKSTSQIKEMAQAHGPEAIKVILRLMKSAENENVRLAAANSLIDRGYGKASQPMEHGGKDGSPIQFEDVGDAARAKALLAFMAKTKAG